MTQYIPNITEDDVERILNREFSKKHHKKIKSLFKNITVNEKYRVVGARHSLSMRFETKVLSVDPNVLLKTLNVWQSIFVTNRSMFH